jgi:FeS assembly SUF system regulator
MIRMSKMTDYGIVLMVGLARAGSARTARQLAHETELPLSTVAKVLKSLNRNGFLQSTRGAQGGYSLLGSADRIRIADLIEALEGPIALTECSSAPGDGQCSHEKTCPVRAPWVQINSAVKNALADISLSDMSAPSFRTLEVER